MAHRILPTSSLLLILAACAGGDNQDQRPASIDSAIAAFKNESLPRLPTNEPKPARVIVGNDTAVAQVAYLCLPDLPVFAVYWNGEHPRVVLNVADSQLSLPQVVAASGARYRVEKPLTEWWNKGDSATFSYDKSRLACGPNSTVEF